MNIGVVILHYKNYNDTIKCANSFVNNFKNANYKVIVVDNFSNDGSFEKLSEYFEKNDNVDVVCTGFNAGFAKGNNFGYKYLKKIGEDCEFVIFCNNDTYINDSDFLKKVIESHKKYNWDVMGPDIIRVYDGVHQNPLQTPKWSTFSINKKILEFSIKIFILKLFPSILCLKKAKKSSYVGDKSRLERREDVCLHGAALVFSKSYLQKFESVFYDKTFLYLEEDLLYLRCKANNLKTIYDDALKIFHNHSSSTKMIYRDEAKRKIFFLKNQIASFKVLKNYLSTLD